MVCGDIYNIYCDTEYKLLNNTTHLGNWSKIKDIEIKLDNYLNNKYKGNNSLVEYWYKYSCIKSKHPLCEQYNTSMINLSSCQKLEGESLSEFNKLETIYKSDLEWFSILNNNLLFNLKNTYIFVHV